jgi:hypothetical protein
MKGTEDMMISYNYLGVDIAKDGLDLNNLVEGCACYNEYCSQVLRDLLHDLFGYFSWFSRPLASACLGTTS